MAKRGAAEPQRILTRRDWLYIGALTLAAALFRFVNLGFPHEIVFDETYFAKFAHDYLTDTKFFDAEPPLAKFIIAFGEWLTGANPEASPLVHPYGWRIMTALFGTAVIPLMYLFVKRLFGGFKMPLFAAVIALFDGLLLVESRVAVIDIFVVFFNLLTYLLFLLHLQAKTFKHSFGWLALTGVSFGLALSVKWITLAFIAPAVLLLLILSQSGRKWVRKLFKVRSRKALFASLGASRTRLHNPLTYLLLLGVVPALLYGLIFSFHVPFDSTHESIWGIHKQIFNYHHTLKASHPYGSEWYTWPLMLRPIAYYFHADGNSWSAIVAMGNPLIWWSGVLALIYATWHFVQRRSLAIGLVVVAFATHFLPWALIDRVLFIYHYLGGLPFMMIALAFALSKSWDWQPKDNAGQVGIWVVLFAVGGILGGLLARSVIPGVLPAAAFVLGALLVMVPIIVFAITDVRKLTWGQKQSITVVALFGLAFLFFLPIWTGIGLSSQDYYRHMWLRSWI